MRVVFCALLLSGIIAVGIDQIGLLGLYERRFAFEPGPWFAEHLAAAVDRPGTCIIVGASTAREGLDPGLLTQSLPGVQFINAATTGGNIEVLEVQAQIVARYGLHPKCVVLGVQPWQLFAEDPPYLHSTGYLAHLRLQDVAALIDRSSMLREIRRLVRAFLIPLDKHALRLNKLVRYYIYSLQNMTRTHPLSLRAYEYFEDEFKRSEDLLYLGAPHYLVERPDDISKRFVYYDKYTYTSTTPERSFERALDLFTVHSERVFVVTMPDSTLMSELNRKGQAAYSRILSRARITGLDCSGLVPDEYFIDETHVDATGRRMVSTRVAQFLSKVWMSGARNGEQHVACRP